MSSRYIPIWLPASILHQEEVLPREFLCDDLNRVCEVAAASGHLPFVATAAATKKRREEVYEEWRLSNFRNYGAWCPYFSDYLLSIGKEDQERIFRGEVEWSDLERAIQNLIETRANAEIEVRKARKRRFAEVLTGLVEDPDPRRGELDVTHSQVPAAAVILEDQSLKFFRKLGTAKEWAARQGLHYILLDLRIGAISRRAPHGAKVDAVQEDEQIESSNVAGSLQTPPESSDQLNLTSGQEEEQPPQT